MQIPRPTALARFSDSAGPRAARPPSPALCHALAVAALFSAACSDGGADPDPDAAGAEVALDGDAAEDDTTETPDTTDTTDGGDGGDDGGSDVQADSERDAPSDGSADAAPACDEGQVTCSEDALQLLTCAGGEWIATECMRAHGQLCQDDQCVPAWTWGGPSWSACEGHERSTASSLADKAAAYDDIARRLHVHPELGWAMSVSLRTETVDCPEGVEPPCRAPVAGPDTATWRDVGTWHSGANDGLWSALYLSSQAFRYAVTGDSEALEMVRLMMRSQERRMAITGVPGLFTRSFRPPDMPELRCPSDPMEYVPDVEKDDDKWVRIGDSGCVETYDPGLERFVASTHCGLEQFSGWCFLDNVSQDEYAGHMAALGAVWKLVDDDEIRGIATRLADQIGTHIVDNDLTFVDWDGRVTEHGLLYPTSLVDSPGFLAAQALAWVKITAEITGREDLRDFYQGCLLQRDGRGACIDRPLETGRPYHTAYLPSMILYVGPDACGTNFNRLSMVFVNMWILLEYETDPEIRSVIQRVLAEEVFRDESSRSIERQRNPWFNFMFAAAKALGPDTDGPALPAVEDGVCSLREFPDDQIRRARDVSGYAFHCTQRLGDPGALDPLPVADRCASTFLWWRSPYDIDPCRDDPAAIMQPGDYLLAYWMGRYYGFIDASW